MTIPKDNSQLENARRLRSEMTPHERKLWYLFLRKYPVKVYKQRIIGKFIVDFYCASAKLVIWLLNWMVLNTMSPRGWPMILSVPHF